MAIQRLCFVDYSQTQSRAKRVIINDMVAPLKTLTLLCKTLVQLSLSTYMYLKNSTKNIVEYLVKCSLSRPKVETHRIRRAPLCNLYKRIYILTCK